MSAQNVVSNGMTMAPLRTGPWNLTDLESVPKNEKKVFSIFHCGGGSTMGYKLAGYDVLGGVEIDPEMMAIYKANHNPKYSYLMGVQDFNKIPRDKIPKELFDLDILDGSPPCSSFSMAGSREKAWGEKKKFREGQANQVLDDLFFHFIETARMLQPKVVVAENVKGLLIGKAKGYVKQIAQGFDDAGYDLQLFLLNAAFMGVPQRRERSFFVAKKKSIQWPKLKLVFKEKPIGCSTAFAGINEIGKSLTPDQYKWWSKCKPGNAFSSIHPKKHWFNAFKLNENTISPTIAGAQGNAGVFHWSKPNRISEAGIVRLQSFPDDFNPLETDVKYVCGMSVPPFMMQRVADQIYKQWLSKEANNG
jgi:DNA (cytosine-5)-methyltransferase 1